MAAPRIYNLFPLLAGTTRDWASHLPRIAAMNFDWVYLNPVHFPGFSGSLYAVKDPTALHPLFQGDSAAEPDRLLADFVAQAEAHGLGVMLDLVVNHTAKDAFLAQDRPDWYYHRPDGSLRSPGAADDSAPGGWIEWGDLAELDYSRPASRDGLVAYWAEVVQRLQRCGVRGFRCDAAYQVPAEAWQRLIAAARAVDGDVVFCAETLGCTPDEIAALESAGFSYVFNSAKYWDFHEAWLLEQYEQVRHIAPSIAFPESHDTPRLVSEHGLADDPEAARQLYKQRYLFAAAFSAGVMMPMGFEFGFRRKLDVVETRPDWWEAPLFDLSNFIAEVNATKAASPALTHEGPQRRLTPPEAELCALLRQAGPDPASGQAAILIDTARREHSVPAGWVLWASGGDCAPLVDATPGAGAGELVPGHDLPLAARDARLVLGAPAAPAAAPAPGEAATALPETGELGPAVALAGLTPGDLGRRAAVGEAVPVTAWLAAPDGAALGAALEVRSPGASEAVAVPAEGPDDGAWQAQLPLARAGIYRWRLRAWQEPFRAWQRGFAERRLRGALADGELATGRAWLDRALAQATGSNRGALAAVAAAYDAAADAAAAGDELLAPGLADRVAQAGIVEGGIASRWRRLPALRRAGRRARWYRLAPWPGGGPASPAFAHAVQRCQGAAALGFDTVLLGPVRVLGSADAPGGLPPEDGLAELVEAVRAEGLEPALDVEIAGTWPELDPDWALALRDALVVWLERGVRTLRLGRPAALPLAAWDWVLGELAAWRSDLVVCAGWGGDSAQARALAELGCCQVETAAPVDAPRRQAGLAARVPTAIAPEPAGRAHLRLDAAPGGTARAGDYPAVMIRACLAAFLAPVASAYEGFEDAQPPQATGGPRAAAAPPAGGLATYLQRLHRIADAVPELAEAPRFLPTANEAIAWFGAWRPGDGEAVLVALCLTPRSGQAGAVALPLAEWGLEPEAELAVREAFSGNRFTWQGRWQHQALDPAINPAAVFHVTVPGL